MPTNVEIRPQEVFRSLESWKRWFMTMLLLMVLAMASSDVEASDPETMYRENQALTISVENVAAFYDSIEQVGEDEVAPINPEVENEAESFQVVIEADDNVRTLDSTAGLIRNYPRGNADVIGWFAATDDDSFGEIQRGYWLVVDNSGQLGAVFTGAVSEPNGSMLTPRELADSNLPQFTFNRGIPTPPAPEGDAEVEVAPTDDNTDGDEGVEVAMAPEGLVAPEVPATINFRNRTLLQIFNGEPGSTSETVNVNAENLLPMPLGLVEQGYSEITDSVSVWEEGDRSSEAWRRIPMSGIILSVDQEPGTNVYLITMRTATENGTPFTALIRMEGIVRFSPVNDQLDLTISQSEADIFQQVNTRFSTDRIMGPTRPIVPGDNITLTIFDVAEAHNNPLGITFTVNSRVNGVSDGTPSNIFRQIDLGNINADEAVVYAAGTGTIIYNQD